MSRNLLIITPEKEAYSTTFIKAHFDFLKGNKKHLFGVFFPIESSGDDAYMKFSIGKKLINKATAIALKKNKRYFHERELLKFVRRNNIDLVLAEFGPVGAEVYNVCKEAQVPLIVHFHGFDAFGKNTLKRYHDQYQEMFKYVHSIIAVSKDMVKQLLALGAPEDKVVYNCYGPSDEFYNLQPNFKELNFLSVGRFVDKKAPYLTLMAFYKLQLKFPQATLTMGGDGPLLSVCKNLAKGLNIENKIAFIGAVSHDKVKELYSSAYCFLQHSVIADNGDSEGTPLGVLEASAAAIPVVATNHAGIKDVVVHGKTGFLVKEGDTDSMAAFMIQLAGDFEIAQKMGLNGRERIKHFFTLDSHIKTLDNLIETAINEKPN